MTRHMTRTVVLVGLLAFVSAPRGVDRTDVASAQALPSFISITPNLVVQNVERSTRFYRDVLGFAVKETVPAQAPFVFVWIERDGVRLFLNDAKTAAVDLPILAGRRAGGTAMLYVRVTGVEALHRSVSRDAKVIMPLKTQPYGMTEFAVLDPDGHVVTFAEERQP